MMRNLRPGQLVLITPRAASTITTPTPYILAARLPRRRRLPRSEKASARTGTLRKQGIAGPLPAASPSDSPDQRALNGHSEAAPDRLVSRITYSSGRYISNVNVYDNARGETLVEIKHKNLWRSVDHRGRRGGTNEANTSFELVCETKTDKFHNHSCKLVL